MNIVVDSTELTWTPQIGDEVVMRGHVTEVREVRVDVSSMVGPPETLPGSRTYTFLIERVEST